MAQGCLFCRIVNKQIPGKIIYEDELAVAFEDIQPQAPVHTLIVPKEHLATLLDVREEDKGILSHLLLVARNIAKSKGIAETGFRLVINNNPKGGQTIYHLHLHLLGGRQMHWPPG